MILAGLLLAFGVSLPLVVVCTALAVILVGAAAIGIEEIHAARNTGDSWVVATGRGIWTAIKTAFSFLF